MANRTSAQIVASMGRLVRLRLAVLMLSAGMPRSGSTLIFNIVRHCLAQKYGNQLSSGWIGDLGTLPPGRAYLLKVHKVDPVLKYRARQIFYSYRDVREVLVSSHRKFGHEPSIERCREHIEEYVRAKQYADCVLKYEDFSVDIEPTISRIAEQLGITVDVAAIKKNLPHPGQLNRASNGVGAYDPTTLMHGGHATGVSAGDWRLELNLSLKKEIHARFGWWFAENSYEFP